MPKPKPRHDKSPEASLTFPLDQVITENDQEVSPVEEQMLAIEAVQVGISPCNASADSYEERKNFWETVSRESEITISKKKRMSLFEEPSASEKQLLAKKRTSVHEISDLPPVPKPRSMLQASYSLVESDGTARQQSESSVDENSASTRISRISESDRSTEDLSVKPFTENQLFYQAPPAQEARIKIRSDVLKSHSKTELQKTDSIDSEKDYSSQAYENAGYISDSGDVEHYISDSEIEDRVPQIRERQMSVAVPIAPVRKSIYERSASLPTEDLYEISARSVKLRKQYYEQQIKKEMIVEQLTSDVEEEPSPERKTLASLTIQEEEPVCSRSTSDSFSVTKDTIPPSLVKETAKSFEKQTPTLSKGDSVKDAKAEKDVSALKENDDLPVKTVKALAKTFEKEIVSEDTGQIGKASRDGLSPEQKVKPHVEVAHVQGSPESDETQKSNVNDASSKVSSVALSSSMHPEETATAISMDKSVESIAKIKRSSTESEHSVSSERSIEFGAVNEAAPTYRDDSTSKPSDSMEVHVDKSEIEDSEKVTDLDQDVTDQETKSLDSLNTTDEHVPEITVTLSGRQKRIGEDEEKIEDSDVPQEARMYQSGQLTEDILWETSVESEPTTTFNETTHEMVLHEMSFVGKEKVIDSDKEVEKDDDFSGSVHEESDLESEIHQDHSNSFTSDKIRSDSHSEIEKIVLESLHHKKVDSEEAKQIATALVQNIKSEIERHQAVKPSQLCEVSHTGEAPVYECVRKLVESKGLDEREVELVESVLARRERKLAKLSRKDTEASSMEITDEDLRYSGTEFDYSNILEQQIDQLEYEKSVDDLKAVYESLEKECKKESMITKSEKEENETIKESLAQKDYETYENGKSTAKKIDIQTRMLDSSKAERRVSEKKDAIIEEDESIWTESLAKKSETRVFQEESSVAEGVPETLKSAATTKESLAKSTATTKEAIEVSTKEFEKVADKTTVSDTQQLTLAGQYTAEAEMEENLENGLKISSVQHDQQVKVISEEESSSASEKIKEISHIDEGKAVEVLETTQKTYSKTASHLTSVDHKQEISVTSKVLGEVVEADLEKFKASGATVYTEKIESMQSAANEKTIIVEHEQVKRTYSSDSRSSEDGSTRSPEDQLSTGSSGRKGDSDTAVKSTLKQDVMLRKAKPQKDLEANIKTDRKSGVEFEGYSSSGESHYHSFEVDSSKSRPCSSDVEGLVPVGSSEYESALTSQDISATSHMTSAEYHTAVSSISSKESMKSLDSESSGNLASVEASEASETLVPSAFEVDRDVLDEGVEEWYEKPVGQSTEKSDSELLSYGGVEGSIDVSEDGDAYAKSYSTDAPSKLKRSHEMTFQPEPVVLTLESPRGGEEKLGSSLDEGSVLSMSVSSTSSATALRTVIGLSQADSERFEGSMAMSGTSEQLSLDDVDVIRGSLENLTYTQQRQTDMSTSAPSQTSNLAIGSVTITTSTVSQDGIQNVSTQVTSEVQSSEKDQYPFKNQDYDDIFEPKKKGHRRQESASFSTSMFSIPFVARTEKEQKIHSDLAESDKFTTKLSYKEVRSDEKKDVDETERDEFYETEADQGFHRDMREGRYLGAESDVDEESKETSDISKPRSQIGKSGPFDDDSQVLELAKQSLSEMAEGPSSSEFPDEYKIKGDAPEFTLEMQASIGELVNESTVTIDGADVDISDSRKLEEKTIPKDVSRKRDSHGGSPSEKSSFEEAEAEAAFSMVAHVSPAHKVKQICPILEDEDAEKHELEIKQHTQRDLEPKQKEPIQDLSPAFIPDIKITQHMAPLVDHGFRYPDLEYEQQPNEKEEAERTEPPQTPSSKVSGDPDQKHDSKVSVPEEAENTLLDHKEEKPGTAEAKSNTGTTTIVEKAAYESEETSQSGSSNSDSFEMLEKPDLIDDFVVIEEVAKEAQEFDTEGKSVKITTKKKSVKRSDAEIEEYLTKSAPSTTTAKMTDLKYYPDGSSSDELGFEFEDSPPQLQKHETSISKKGRDYVYDYDRELEANRKWIEQQFQGDQAAMAAAGYGYQMEFERGPLEDIKEEDINDFDPTSSRIGSLGSQKGSGGSLGSVKDSFSSTPEYDVLAGRKYFTRSGEHDDVSMSSLQEFENLERAMSLETRKYHQGSQDSLSNGSFGRRYYASRSGQGDDVSISSLKEFEGLEKACIDAHKIEIKVKEEEAILTQIDEGQESIASEETESCETISGTDKKVIPDSDEEDYKKRIFEIDEIIKQAQTKVERFVDFKDCEKTESLGRGDSFEEVAKVPELELDVVTQKASSKVQWADTEDPLITSTDSLDMQRCQTSRIDSTDSLEQKTTAVDIMTASTDSIEFQMHKAKDATQLTDSFEIKDEDRSNIVQSDSLELATGLAADVGGYSDSIDEDGSKFDTCDRSVSSEKEGAGLPKEIPEADLRASTDSLDRSSSVATHATYQHDTDSVFSGSFTSAGSSTMVSSTDTVEKQDTNDLAAALREIWFDDNISAVDRSFTGGYYDDDSKPYVTEVIEPCEEADFSHTIHRRVEMPPVITKATFTGADAEEQLQRFLEEFDEGEDVQESEETDKDGNVHVKRVVQKRFIIRDDSSARPDLQAHGVIKRTCTDGQGIKTIYTQEFDVPGESLVASVAGDTGSSVFCQEFKPYKYFTPKLVAFLILVVYFVGHRARFW